MPNTHCQANIIARIIIYLIEYHDHQKFHDLSSIGLRLIPLYFIYTTALFDHILVERF